MPFLELQRAVSRLQMSIDQAITRWVRGKEEGDGGKRKQPHGGG